MKKKNLFKVLVGLTLGFGAIALTTPVFADEVATEPETTETIESQESNTDENTESTEIEPVIEENNEDKSAVDKMLDKLSRTEIKATLTLLLFKLGFDSTVLLALAIYIIKSKSKQILASESYQAAKEKADKDTQEKLEKLEKQYIASIDKLTETINSVLAKQNSDKRIEADKKINEVLEAIQNTKADLD